MSEEQHETVNGVPSTGLREWRPEHQPRLAVVHGPHDAPMHQDNRVPHSDVISVYINDETA